MSTDISTLLTSIENDIAVLRALIQHDEAKADWVSDTDRRISNNIVQLAWVQAYVGARGANGCGDSGPNHAYHCAEKYVKRVIRKAIGYTIP